jgi:hypothetical protein
MFKELVTFAVGAGIGVLTGVSLGAQLRIEIKTGFDNLATKVAAEIKALAVAVRQKV